LPPREVAGKLPIVSIAVTRGIRVSVEMAYLAEQSDPMSKRFVFAYTVTIANEGRDTVKLRTRHWVITDASGHVEEVRGEGVVGEQPVLEPNQAFQYTSGCILKTPWGTMSGSYQMFMRDGSSFDAEIAPFLLATPTASPGGAPN
jgi:ApaG protein